MQQLSGYLNFLSRAVVPGRTFTRRMYAKYSKVVNTGGAPQNANQFKIKQHHHVKLDKEFKLDCQIWLEFLDGDLRQVVDRPMIDLFSQPNSSVDIGFSLDASASKQSGGFGAILKNQ